MYTFAVLIQLNHSKYEVPEGGGGQNPSIRPPHISRIFCCESGCGGDRQLSVAYTVKRMIFAGLAILITQALENWKSQKALNHYCRVGWSDTIILANFENAPKLSIFKDQFYKSVKLCCAWCTQGKVMIFT